MERSRKKKSKATDDLTDELLSHWNPSEFENVLVSTQVLAHLMARAPRVECDDTAKTAGKSAEDLSTTIKLRCSACSNKESLPLTIIRRPTKLDAQQPSQNDYKAVKAGLIHSPPPTTRTWPG